MSLEITKEEAAELISAADMIYSVIGYAQGRADQSLARREEFVLLQFPTRRAQNNSAETALNFSQKELTKMPRFFRSIYKIKGGTAAHIRKKENGTYEIRYRRNGFNISVSSKNLQEAKERFIEALRHARQEDPVVNGKILFKQYAEQWIEVVKRPQVKTKTLQNYIQTLRHYIYPEFAEKQMKEIRPIDIQKLLNDLTESDRYRSAEAVYVILKAIFNFAVAEDIVPKSPLNIIRKPKHATKHGQALSLDEERIFVEKCVERRTQRGYAFLFLLFTGIRRSELASAEISSPWIIVTTSKVRRGEEPQKRKIPISPMLAPFIQFMTKEVLSSSPEKLTKEFPTFLPERHLHELRHTFITRCQECGISRELTSLWAGHRADNTMTSNVYTHFSDAYQLEEIKKLKY